MKSIKFLTVAALVTSLVGGAAMAADAPIASTTSTDAKVDTGIAKTDTSAKTDVKAPVKGKHSHKGKKSETKSEVKTDDSIKSDSAVK